MVSIDKSLINDIERFSNSIWSVRKNFEKVQSEKIYWVNLLAEHFPSEQQIEGYLNNLERTNRKEQKYFNLIYKYFLEFFSKIKKIEKEINESSHSEVQGEIREFIELNKEYFLILIDVCESLNKILKKSEARIYDEEHHLKKAKGNIFTKDERINFLKQYEIFLKSFSEEAAIEASVKDLNKKYYLLQTLLRKIRALGNKLEYKSSDKPLITMFIGILGIGIASGDFLTIIMGIILSAGGYYTAIVKARKRFRNILGQTKFRL